MTKSNATKSIIIIDDDVDVLNSIKFIFRKNINYKISYFSNSEEAFNDILNNDYDIIITDIEMPIISGVDMIIELQKIKKLNKIIFISSNIDKYKNIISKLNILYLCKPITKNKLLEIINV